MSKHIGKLDTPYGEGMLVASRYGSNGALALVIEPGIGTVSVNLDHGQPCVQSGELPPGHFYLNENNLSEKMLTALRASGYFEETELPVGVSGYCTYPVWKLIERQPAASLLALDNGVVA